MHRTRIAVIVRNHMNERGLDEEHLLSAVGMPHATYHSRMNHPENLRLYEVHKFDKILHFTDEEKQEIATGVSK